MSPVWLSRGGRSNAHVHRTLIESKYCELVGKVGSHWPDGDRRMNAAGREYAHQNLVIERQIKTQDAQN